MYRLSSSLLPSIRSWDQLDWESLAGKTHIAELNELTESEVTELTTSTVDETALAILRGQGSQEITIVSSQKKFIFDIYILSILTA